jgi:GTPase SAR1 family protein
MSDSSIITCLILGDKGVGKSTLIEQFGHLLGSTLDQKGPHGGILLTIEPNQIITKRTQIEFIEYDNPASARYIPNIFINFSFSSCPYLSFIDYYSILNIFVALINIYKIVFVARW